MAQGRFAVTSHSRAEGHSAAAALAYRGGLALEDARTGEVFDYSWRDDRQQIVWSGLVGVGADTVFGGDVQAFADSLEFAEKRSNSRIGRDLKLNLPYELPLQQRIELAVKIGEDISARYHTPCHVGVHFADPSGDDRNDHTHVYVPTRQLLDAGRFGPKLRILDDFKTGTDEIKALLGMYESRTNEALERAGIETRIDVSRQDHDPQPRLGRTATALEREAARRQGIDPRGIRMADLVCRIEPTTPQGHALREHVLTERKTQRDLEEEIARDQEQSRRQAGALYEAEPTDPGSHVVQVDAPARRRRMTREERRAQRATRRAERGAERPRRRRAHHQAQVQVVEVQHLAPTRPAPARRVPIPTVAAIPTVTAERPRQAGRRPERSASRKIAAHVQVTPALRPAGLARPAASAPISTVAAILTVTAARLRQAGRRPERSASRKIAAHVQVTPTLRPAGLARPAASAPIPTISAQTTSRPSKPAAGIPARPSASIPAARSRPARARFIGTEIIEFTIPPTIEQIGADLAEDPATVHTDWAGCYHAVREEHTTMRAVLAAAHEHDAERRRKGEIPATQPTFILDQGPLEQILEWIHDQLTVFVGWLRKIQQTEREIASPGKRADPKQAAPARPTITRGGRAVSPGRPDARDPSRGPPRR